MEASGIRIIYYNSQFAEFSIYDTADLHLLNRGCSKTHIMRDIQRISDDPFAIDFIGGDYADWISPHDKRFDPEAYDEEITVNDLASVAAVVTVWMKRLYTPIIGKIAGALIGNHEFQYLSRQSEINVHNEICKQLKTPNMRFSGFTDIYFVYSPKAKTKCRMTIGKTPPKYFTAKLRVFIHHGSGAANTAGGKINKLKSLVDMVDADLVMMGHVHEQFAKAFLRLVPNEDCSEIGQKTTMGLITGSYLKTYSPDFTGYGEIKGYSPTTLGATRARYIPWDRTLTVENRGDNVGTKGNQ